LRLFNQVLYCGAGTAVKLKNLYLCRSALEQGLRCSPNHWPCLENVITATYKLGDNLACLGYCSIALGKYG
jgi:calcineurin-binding protein cabin-1